MEYLDGAKLKGLIAAGADYLDANRKTVDALNVFPVPDGDTGTNMALTMLAASREVQKVSGTSLTAITGAMATGSLMGARGNSGVILSQIFRGMARKMAGKEVLSTTDLAEALQEGVNTAYRAVMKPVEGTILTVARESAQTALQVSRQQTDLILFLRAVHAQAQQTLERTPSLLPVLKQAGVVDAGGKGFVYILEGALRFLQGQSADQTSVEPIRTAEPAVRVDQVEASDLEHPYCTELLLTAAVPGLSEDIVRERLSRFGDSLLVVGSGELLKIHVHTADPGGVLSYCRELGEMRDIKIDNMRYQHRSLHQEDTAAAEAVPDAPAGPAAPDYGIVAVVMGDGLAEIYTSLGADRIVQGGQTMNPSTQDLAQAAEGLAAGRVIILPNNGNIIMAAEQVKELSDKEITVVPTRSVPEGIAALLAFEPEATGPENRAKMERAAQTVQTGEVTYAVRETRSGEITVREGDIIGLWNREIRACGQTPAIVAADLVRQMVSDEASLITLYYGSDVPAGAAEELAAGLTAEHSHCGVEVYAGGQPLYYYLISVE